MTEMIQQVTKYLQTLIATDGPIQALAEFRKNSVKDEYKLIVSRHIPQWNLFGRYTQYRLKQKLKRVSAIANAMEKRVVAQKLALGYLQQGKFGEVATLLEQLRSEAIRDCDTSTVIKLNAYIQSIEALERENKKAS